MASSPDAQHRPAYFTRRGGPGRDDVCKPEPAAAASLDHRPPCAAGMLAAVPATPHGLEGQKTDLTPCRVILNLGS